MVASERRPPGLASAGRRGGNSCLARPAARLPVRCANDENYCTFIIVCCASLASRASLRCIIRRCPYCRDGDKSFANISCNCHIHVVAATRWRSLTRCPRPLFIYVAEIAAAARSAFVECLACLNSLRRSDCRVGSEGHAASALGSGMVWAGCRCRLVVHCTVVEWSGCRPHGSKTFDTISQIAARKRAIGEMRMRATNMS